MASFPQSAGSSALKNTVCLNCSGPRFGSGNTIGEPFVFAANSWEASPHSPSFFCSGSPNSFLFSSDPRGITPSSARLRVA